MMHAHPGIHHFVLHGKHLSFISFVKDGKCKQANKQDKIEEKKRMNNMEEENSSSMAIMNCMSFCSACFQSVIAKFSSCYYCAGFCLANHCDASQTSSCMSGLMVRGRSLQQGTGGLIPPF